MSWEVQNMKSKTSYFNMGLCKNLLKRFWPLHLAWLCLLLARLPIQISSYPDTEWIRSTLNLNILDSGIYSAKYGIVASVLSVMAMFSHLYNRRDCGLINSLPLRREATFITACLTGLLPLLAAAVLAWLVGLLVFAGNPYIGTHYVNLWLLTVVLSLVAFYGMAVFCAMLTGNILILPLLFIVLNVVVYGIEVLIRSLLGKLIYGYAYPDLHTIWFSPWIHMNRILFSSSSTADGSELPEGQYTIHGLNVLAVYAAVGVVLMIAALLLYRRRQMETAGDVVAIQVLKPVFRVCASFCAGLLFSYTLLDVGLLNHFHGKAAAAICIVLMILGAALGYYAAEMLMQKSLQVFRGTRVTGLVAVCLLLSLGTLCFELDLFGYESRIPRQEDILAVEVPGDWRFVKGPEAIDLYLQLHARILENKDHNERAAAENSRTIRLKYQLKDGSSLTRNYSIDTSQDWVDSVYSEMALAQEINQLTGVKEQLNSTQIPLERDSILRASVIYDAYADDANGDRILSESLRLTPDQALELYWDCLIPDMQDSSLGTHWYYMSQEAQELNSNISIYYELAAPDNDFEENALREMAGQTIWEMDYLNITVTMDARRTIAWLKEATGLIPASSSTFYSPSYD